MFVGTQAPVRRETNAQVCWEIEIGSKGQDTEKAKRAHHGDTSGRPVLLHRAGRQVEMDVNGLGELEGILGP